MRGPSNPNIVWVGTGEANPRNSVSYGDGVYKSTDGGRTWKNMGLKETFQIGRIAIHPKNPEIVYVGALGRLYAPTRSAACSRRRRRRELEANPLHRRQHRRLDSRCTPPTPDTLLVPVGAPPRRLRLLPRRTAARRNGRLDPITRWGKNAGIYKTTDGADVQPHDARPADKPAGPYRPGLLSQGSRTSSSPSSIARRSAWARREGRSGGGYLAFRARRRPRPPALV